MMKKFTFKEVENSRASRIRRLIYTLLVALFLSLSVSAQKTVHVRTYTRKDGTMVHSHDRSAPVTASSSSSRRTSSRVTSSGIYSAPTQPTRDVEGKIRRSSSAKHEFMKMKPCPSTGRSSGGCPGYVVDHITPLACGGQDAPSNMHWQTKEAAKAKDKWERNGCH
jgi:hypothetical protein